MKVLLKLNCYPRSLRTRNLSKTCSIYKISEFLSNTLSHSCKKNFWPHHLTRFNFETCFAGIKIILNSIWRKKIGFKISRWLFCPPGLPPTSLYCNALAQFGKRPDWRPLLAPFLMFRLVVFIVSIVGLVNFRKTANTFFCFKEISSSRKYGPGNTG